MTRLIVGLVLLVWTLIGSSLVSSVHAAANINRSINYQGRLLTTGGTNVADGAYAMKFSVYNTASGGTPLWTASGTNAVPTTISVQVTDGLFSVLLGDTSFQGQNPFAFDFNQDGLYLGVSIAGDSEMTPRKRLSSVPYAFNSEALQGQFASSTDISGTSGTGTLFALNQASSTAASATRTTLLIETAGTSDFFDYLLRAKPKNGADVFSISRAGNVTSTGNFVIGDASTDLFTVNARINSDLIPSQDLVYSLGSAALRWNAQLGTVTSTNIFNSGTVSSTNLVVSNNATLNNVTSTNLYTSGTVSTTQLFVNGTQITGGTPATTATLQVITTNGATTTNLIYAQGGVFSSASSTFTSDLTVLGQTSLQLLSFTNATGSAVTTTQLFVSGTASTTQLYVNGSTVCLTSGVNCPSGSALGAITSSTWQYNNISNIAFLTTSTQDVLVGGGNSTSSALFVVDYRGNTGTATNTILLGGVTTTLVGIGTSTPAATLDVVGHVNNLIQSGASIPQLSEIDLGGGVLLTTIVDGNTLYALKTSELYVIDITDSRYPRVLGSLSIAGSELRVMGHRAYVHHVDSGTLSIIDVSDPSLMSVMSTYTTSSFRGLEVVGKYAYLNAGTGGIDAIDISSSTNPVYAGGASIGANQLTGSGVLREHNGFIYAFGAAGNGVYDIRSNPAQPIYVTSSSEYPGDDAVIQGNIAYVVHQSNGFTILNYANATSPAMLATLPAETAERIAVHGRYAYTNQSSNFTIYDISSSTNPLITKTLSDTPNSLTVSGNKLVMGFIGSPNIRIFDIPGIETASLLADNAEIGGLNVFGDIRAEKDVFIGQSLFLGEGGLMSHGPGNFMKGLTVEGVDVCLEDGTNCPASSGSISSSTWQYNGTSNIAFLTTSTQDVLMGGGNTTSSALFVVDYRGNTGIATNTILLGGSTTTFVGIGTSTPIEALDVVGNIRNVLVPGGAGLKPLKRVDYSSNATVDDSYETGGLLYTVGSGMLRIVDISDLLTPRILIATTTISNANRIEVIGTKAYLASQANELEVIDVADPSNLRTVSYQSTTGEGIEIYGNYLYQMSSTDISVFDLRLPQPTFVTSVGVNGNQFFNTGDLAVHDGYLYAVGNAGWGVFDLRDPRYPVYVSSSNSFTGDDISFSGDRAYVSGSSGSAFYILDVSVATTPGILHTLAGNFQQVEAIGDYVYVMDTGAGTLNTYDVASSTNPILLNQQTAGNVRSLRVYGRHVVLGYLRFLFNPVSFDIFEIPGVDTAAIYARSAEFGKLDVSGNIQTNGSLRVQEGIVAGAGGLTTLGALSVYSDVTTSTFAFAVSSTFGEFSQRLTVGGVNVCLSNGINCPAVAGSGWTFDGLNNTLYTTTATQDVLLGGNTTSSALFVVDYRGNTGTATNTILLGGVTTTLVGIGTTNPLANLDIVGNIRNVHASSQTIKATYFSEDLGLGLVRGITVVGRIAYVISEDSNRLYLVDVSNPFVPLVISSVTIPVGAYAVSVDGRYAATISNSAEVLTLIDISNPSAPKVMTSTAVSNPIQVVIQGRYVYVTNNFDGYLEIFDMVDPTKLTRVGFVDLGTSAAGLYLKGRYAYVTGISNSSVFVVDVANPQNPILLGSAVVGSQPIGVWATEEYMYVTNRNSDEFNILRITDPASPVVIATATTESYPTSVNVQGRYAYITNYLSETLQVFDITSSTNPTSVVSVNAGGSLGVSGNFVSGKYAYITGYSGSTFGIFDLGGIETIGVNAESVRTGSLNVLSDGYIANNLFISSALNVGIGGMYTAGSLAVGSTNTTSTILFAVSSTVAEFSQRLTVGGVNVCLQNGTNCPASSGSISTSTWQYNGISNIAFLTTSTQDVLLGGNTTATAGFIWDNGSQGTSTLTIGGSTNTNVLVGTTTYGGGLSTRFGLSGNDLFTQGMIGSIEGMFSATGVTVGTGTTVYADGNIYRTNGGIQLTPSAGSNVSTTANFVPTSDNALSIGTSAFRWQANLGYVTSVAVTTTNLFAATVSTTNLSVGGFGVCLSSGTNCPAGSSGAMTSSTWQYSYTSNTAFLTTSTMDVLMGGGNTTSSALFVVDYKGNTGTATNTILLGGGTTTFVGIGTLTPSSTLDVVGGVTNIMRSGQAMTTLQTANVGSTPLQTIIRGNRLYLINGTTGINNFRIYDISDATTSTYLGGLSLSTTPVRFSVVGNVAYVLTASRLISIDVTDPAMPSTLFSATITDGTPRDLDIHGNYAYTVGFSGGRIQTFDVSNPSNISSVYITGVSSTEGWNSVSYQNGFFYAVDNFGATYDFQVFNASTTSSTLVGQYSTTTLLYSAVVNGRYAYVSQASNNRIVVMDIASSTNPIPVGYVTVGSIPRRMKIEGRYLYVSNEGGSSVSIVDIASSTAPVLIRSVSVGSTPVGMSISGSYLYVPNSGASTMSVIDMQTGIETSALTAANGSFGTLQVEGDQSILGRLDVQGAITANGKTVCLSDGSTCPGAVVFAVSSTIGIAYLNASTSQDLFIGGGQTTSSALFVVDYKGNTGTATNTILLGGGTTTFVGIGTLTPSSTLDVVGGVTNIMRSGQAMTTLQTANVGSTPLQTIIRGNRLYLINGTTGINNFRIYDISDATTSTYLGGLSLSTAPVRFSVVGNVAYVLTASRLISIDVTDPAMPSTLFSATITDGNARDIDINGNYVYTVGASGGRIQTFDVSNPSNISSVYLSAASTTEGWNSVAYQSGFLYVVDNSVSTYDFQVFSATTTSSTLVGQYSTTTLLHSAVVNGRYAYVSQSSNSRVVVMDIASTTNPIPVGYVTVGSLPRRMKIEGRYLYVSNESTGSVSIVDIASSTAPVLIRSVTVGSTPVGMSISGSYLYVPNSGASTMSVIDMQTGIETSALTAANGSFGTLQVEGDQSILGRLDVQGAITSGGKTVCVADGTNCPGVTLFTVSSTSGFAYLNASSSQDLLIGGGQTTSSALFVVDYKGNTGTATNTILLGGVTTTLIGVGTSTPVATLDVIGTIDNDLRNLNKVQVEAVVTSTVETNESDLIVSGDYAYFIPALGSAARLQVFGIAESKYPKFISSYNLGSQTVFSDNQISGRYLYALYNSGANNLSIFDVSDPTNVVKVSTSTVGYNITYTGTLVNSFYYTTPGANGTGSIVAYDITNPYSVRETSSSAGVLIHNAGVEELVAQGDYIYGSQGNTGLIVYSIKNPSVPTVYSTTTFGTGFASTNDLAVQGQYLYAAKTGGVLNIIDISNPRFPLVIATSTAASQPPLKIKVQGKYVYGYSDSHYLTVFDVSSSTNPIIVGQYNTGVSAPGNANGREFAVRGRYAYLGAATSIDSRGRFTILDLGSGVETNALNVGSLFASDAYVQGDLSVQKTFSALGGMRVGTNGILSEGPLQIMATGTTSTFMGAITVSGYTVCLSSGLNCPGASLIVGSLTSSTWQYNGTSNISFLTTTTQDVLMGGNTTATAGFIWDSGSQGTSTLIVGGSTNTNLLVGTSTYGGGLNSRFGLSGNDLLTQGMIGSIEGMFSATGVTVGTGTTVYADGNIYRTNGGIQFSPSTGSNVSSTANFVPVADGTLSIGTAVFRWQGNFTSVTSTGVTSTNLFVSGTASSTSLNALFTTSTSLFVSGTASSTNLNAMFATSTSLFVSGTASTTRLNALNVTTTSLFVSGTVSTTNLLVGGLGVCLSTGTNCPAGTSGAMTSSTWQYNFTANTAFLNTSTMDVLMGGGNTTSSALFVVDYRGNAGTATNTILLGGVTTTFVGIGTSTPRTTFDVAGSVSNILRSGQTLSLLRNITGVGSTPNQVVVRGNYLHLINQSTSADNFKVFDVSNPASSTVVGKLSITSGTPQRMSIVGNRAYVITETPALLYAIDLSDRARPVVLSSVAITDTGVRDIDVSGQYAYVASFGTGAIEKFDISAPTAMTSVVQIASSSHGWLDIEVQGRYLYAVDNFTPTLQIYDASTTTPVLKSELSITGAQGLSVQGRFAYVTLSTGGVQVVDIASSTRPIALGSLVIGTNSNRSTVDGRYLYLSNESGSSISVVDVSSSTAPNLVSTVTVGSTPRGLSVAGRYLYVPNSGATTVSIIDLLGTEVSSLTAANASIGGLQVLQDMMVQGNMDVGGDLTVGGRFVCLSDGTGCPAIGGWTESTANNTVSLTTVGRDVLLGGSTSATAGFIWDKGVNGTSTLFVGATTNTNVVFGVNTTSFTNITGLSGYVMDGNDLLVGGKIGALSGLAVRGNIDGALGVGQTFNSTSTNFNLTYSGPIVVHDRYLYQATVSNLVIYDISQYGVPRIVATQNYFSGGNYNDIAYFNGLILLSSSDGYHAVVDVSSSTNPIAVTQWGNGGSVNRQHALPHPNGRYVYTTNGSTQINVTDMIDPANPLELFTTSTNGGGSQLVTEMVTDGKYLYVAIGTAVPTFEIYDLSIPTRPRKISQITSGITGLEHLAVQGDYVYLAEGPAINEIDVVDVRDRRNPRIVKTISPDGGTRADEILVAGRYMYLGSGTGDVDIYDISSSTNPIFIQNIVLNTGATNMALAGKYLYVSDLNIIATVNVGSMETNALQAYTAEITRLMVRDSLDVFQDAHIEGGLTVGSNSLDQSYGSISVYASTTSGTVMTLVNNSYNSLDAVLEVRSGCGAGSSDLALFGSNADNRLVSIRCNGQIFADNGTVSTPADYAEYFFASSSDLVAGDAVVLNADVLAYASTSKAHILKGETDLRAKTLGIVSTRPGFVANGADNRENDPAWKVIALMGQVPAKADATVDPIVAGDEIMLGAAGTIVKAHGPGMVVGRALEPLNAGTGTIQVYVQPHWWAGDLFSTDGSGNTLLVDDLTVASSTIASATSTLIDSPFFTFTAKAWDIASSTEVTHSFKLFADAISSTTSLFSIANASGTSLLDLSNEGDLTVHGKLYLANKSTGMGSTSTYLFIDDTAPSSTMVSTNADGFQAQAAYDYAERYPSQENLEPGDLVTFDAAGPVNSMKRTSSAADAVSGIVSTKPGFLTGAYASGTYPIALAGRVPTKVTASNGSIKVGDALTASNIPGVAMKATQPGIIVGYALENFDLPETGLVQVFVKTGYFGGTVDAAGAVTYAPQSSAVEQIEIEGLALIAAGQTEVKVSFASLKALPAVYVTPGASVDGGWWIASKTDTGFMIILEKPQTHDVEFSWLARPLQMGVKRFKSDNTNETVDPLSGNGIPQVQDSGGESPSSTSSTQTP